MREYLIPSPASPSHQVLAAAGAVNHDELVKMAADAFGSIPDEDPATAARALLAKVGGGPGPWTDGHSVKATSTGQWRWAEGALRGRVELLARWAEA